MDVLTTQPELWTSDRGDDSVPSLDDLDPTQRGGREEEGAGNPGLSPSWDDWLPRQGPERHEDQRGLFTLWDSPSLLEVTFTSINLTSSLKGLSSFEWVSDRVRPLFPGLSTYGVEWDEEPLSDQPGIERN